MRIRMITYNDGMLQGSQSLPCSDKLLELLSECSAPLSVELQHAIWSGGRLGGKCTLLDFCRCVLVERDLAEYASAKLRGFSPEIELIRELGFMSDTVQAWTVVFYAYD